MVSEVICLEILKLMRGKRATFTERYNPKDIGGEVTSRESHVEAALTEQDLYRSLLANYEFTAIDASVRWLQIGGFIGIMGWGLRGPCVYTLTDKGRSVADAGAFPEVERKLFYTVDPYAIFLAHQFNTDDEDLVKYLRTEVLEPNGFTVLEGRADGLEEFRHAILTKIQKARFFLCLLTRREVLKGGGYVSSVWLYQEIGAAMAYGKRPLLLVEEGIDPQYVGELQRVYEHLPFTRSNHPGVFKSVLRRIKVDLEVALIPIPAPLRG